jgi:hypothetical protein
MIPYTAHTVRRAADINLPDWCAAGGMHPSPTLDARFLTTVEHAFAADSEFWYVTFYDGERPIGCACFSTYRVDAALMAPAAIRRGVTVIRKLWRRFLRFRLFLCGLPASTCGCEIGVAEGADEDRLAASLAETAQKIAGKAGCVLVSFKEFTPQMASRLKPLERHGFRRAKILTAHHLDGDFGSWEKYYASRSKRTRANIRKHFRKLDQAGLTWEHRRGRDGVAELFTDEVHQLYLNVRNRAEVTFELNPPEFFRELARQYPDDSCFTFVRRGGRIVGFCCGLASPGEHTLLFCGLDYSLNPAADLYFNLIYRGLQQGLVPGVRTVRVGATATEFKQHMGCRLVPLSIYVRAVGIIPTLIFNRVVGFLFELEQDPAAVGAAPRPDAAVLGRPRP